MSVPHRKSALAAALSMAVAAPFASAQLQLEEVIVTAQKRAESLQDVPISVSAVQGDKISDAGIPNMAALADYVPNLFISDAPVSTNIYMRGMGSSNNQAFEQSVGMYIDGVYMGRGRQYRSPFMDIQRVEVLRGPQGTLFGKNTVAGAVNVITASPTTDEELNGNIALSVEDNDGYIVEGMLSGAVTDSFALRGAIKYRETEGYVENTFLDQDEPEVEETVWRISAVWQASDNFDATLKYGESNYERTGVASGANLYLDAAQRAEQVPNRSAFADIAYTLMDVYYPTFGTDIQEEFTIIKDNNFGPGLQPVPNSSGAAIGINPELSDNETQNMSLNLNWYIGEHTLTAVTGYSAYNYVDGADVDWLPLQFISRDDDQDFKQFSQEIRLTSPTEGRFNYIAGLYYEENELEFDRRVVIDTNMGGLVPPVLGVENLLALLTGGAYSANQIARDHYFKQDADSWAIFGQGTFNFTDSVRLTLGLRYTEEKKEVESIQTLSDSVTGIGVPSDNFFLGLIQAQNFNTYRYNYNEDRDTDAWIPSVNLQWDVTDSSMLYVSWSEGFKSGGFTGADDGNPGDLGVAEWPCIPSQPLEACYDPTNPADDFEFDDEEVQAWELGGKHSLGDGRATLNWAAFHTEYTNLQTSIFKGVGFGVTNAAEVTVQGIEADLLWQATEGLRIGANGSWLDAEYDAYPTAPCTAIQLDVDPLCGTPGGFTDNDLAGENTTFAPEYSASLFFDYNHLFSNGLEFFLGGEANYSDEFDTQGDLDVADLTDSYTKYNLRGGLRGSDGAWELMLYGRNLTDEEVSIYGFDVPVLAGSHATMYDEGRVIGARFRYVWE